MSESVQESTTAGTASTALSYEDKVDAAYKECEKQAGQVVRYDFQFRNARKELVQKCYLLLTTAFTPRQIDETLRVKQEAPEAVAEAFKKHDLEPPKPWSFNPVQGIVAHFYYKARAAVTERGTAGGKEFPVTEQEVTDYINAASDLYPDKPTISETQAKNGIDLNPEAEWAKLSRYSRWLMQAVDMEHLGVKVFDMSMKEAEKEYQRWLKQEPFMDFLTQPVPSGMRKPSIARQAAAPTGTGSRGGRKSRVVLGSSGTTAPSGTTAAPPPPPPAATPKVDPTLDKLKQMTGLATAPVEEEKSPEQQIMEAAQGQSLTTVTTIPSPYLPPDVEETEAPDDEVVSTEQVATTQTQTADEAEAEATEAEAFQASQGTPVVEPVVEPTQGAGTAEAPVTETVTEEQAEPVLPEAPKAPTVDYQAVELAADKAVNETGEGAIQSAPVETQPVLVQPEVVEAEALMTLHEVISVSQVSYDALPAEGLLAYRKLADGTTSLVVVAAFARHS